MDQLSKYVLESTSEALELSPLPKTDRDRLPFYLGESYEINTGELMGTQLIFARPTQSEDLTTGALMKHVRAIGHQFKKPVVLVTEDMTTIRRRRLANDKINFIVPFKYLYLPSLMMDFREQADEKQYGTKPETLLPSAQFMLFFHIIHRKENRKVEGVSYKQLAEMLNYSAMSITNAVQNLRLHGLCTVEGTKEKQIRFVADRQELWKLAYPYLVSPVLKTIFMDELPKRTHIYYTSGENALAAYSDLNEINSATYAIYRNDYNQMEKAGKFDHANPYEGPIELEIWKYEPDTLASGLKGSTVVDPLSLYLIMRDIKDERVEIALDQIINDYIW